MNKMYFSKKINLKEDQRICLSKHNDTSDKDEDANLNNSLGSPHFPTPQKSCISHIHISKA